MATLEFHLTCVCKKKISLFLDTTDVSKLRQFITCDDCKAVIEMMFRFVSVPSSKEAIAENKVAIPDAPRECGSGKCDCKA